MYRKYYSYSDMPIPITPQNKSEKSEKEEKRDNIHTSDNNSNCEKNISDNNNNDCNIQKAENKDNECHCNEVNRKNESEACRMNDSVCTKRKSGTIGGFLGNMAVDDLILAAVILALLIDDCDDKLLIGAIIFIFLNM